jgi:NCAIR mutase (PurE)-related protein
MSVRRERLRALLEGFARGQISDEELLRLLDRDPVEHLPFAALDHHRALRLGHPEAIFCQGKSTEQVSEIARRMADRGEGFLATRADSPTLDLLEATYPDLELSRPGRVAHLPPATPVHPPVLGSVLVVSAGTADIPVAEEAVVTARAYGNPVHVRYDVGVAGLHRILELRDELQGAAVVIVVAGMDGALASVVGGLVGTPVVAVPTSVGYGASVGGVAALLAMLSSCAPGVSVVNVDNGYGAACAATRINQAALARTGDPEPANRKVD